jgi:hypothetical protein
MVRNKTNHISRRKDPALAVYFSKNDSCLDFTLYPKTDSHGMVSVYGNTEKAY